MDAILRWRDRLLALAGAMGWLPPLLARLSLAAIFVPSGWRKLHNLGDVTEFFTSLHIPAPHFNAVLVASTELVCGLLLLIGLASRLAALPLIISMLIAILTAKRGDIGGALDLLGLAEYLYIVLLAWIAIAGPGPIALDRLLRPRSRR